MGNSRFSGEFTAFDTQNIQNAHRLTCGDVIVALAVAIVSFVGPVRLPIVVYSLAVTTIAVGFVFTLRDYSPECR